MFEDGAPTHSSRRAAVLNRHLHRRLLDESAAPPARLGRYELLERIASGGMGTVYLANDEVLDRRVAVKVLHGGFAPSAGLLVTEGQALARLHHENVVEVFDVGVDPAGASTVFIAMEYVPGLDLAGWLRTAPARRDIVHAFIQAGRGLAAAHAAGLIHGDFKPSNVLRADDGRIKVIDFGVARILEDASATQGWSSPGVPSRTAGGTLGYSAPEKLETGAESPASDVFSFCVALYEALSGGLPFAANDRSTFLESMRIGPRLPLPRDVPRPVRTALLRGMCVDPRRRWPTMLSLVAHLERFEAPADRQRAGWVLAASSVLGVAAWSGLATDDSDTCQHQGAATRLAWASQRPEVGAVFASAPEEFVVSGGHTVIDNLDRYVDDLVETHAAVCEAASRGTVAPLLTTARTRCLQRRQQEFERFLGTLGDAQGRRGALAESYGLARVEPCLRADPIPEAPPELRDEVSALDARLDELLALDGPTSRGEGLEEAEALVAQAYVLGHAPSSIRALTALGSSRMTAGDSEGAHAVWEEAYFAAQRGRMPMRSLELSTNLVSTSVALGRYDDAWAWSRHARAATAHTHDPVAATRVSYAEAIILLKLERPAEALVRLDETLQTRSSVLGPNHPAVADVYLELGNTHLAMGEYDRALEMLQRARRVNEAALGLRHPGLAIADNNIGAVQFHLGQLDAAERTWSRALSIRADALGSNHIEQLGTLENLAKLAVTRGEWDEGLSYVHRALQVWESAGLGDDHPDLVGTLEVLGMIQLERGELEAARKPSPKRSRSATLCMATSRCPHWVRSPGQPVRRGHWVMRRRRFDTHDVFSRVAAQRSSAKRRPRASYGCRPKQSGRGAPSTNPGVRLPVPSKRTNRSATLRQRRQSYTGWRPAMPEPEPPGPNVDVSLLTRWQDGDRRAGSELIDRYDGLLLRFFRTKAGDDAEDLVQRTFLRCVERKDALVELHSFRAYLLATARSVLVDHYRKAGRHARRFDPLETSVADLNPSLSTHVAVQQERRQLVEALREIPLELQVALELFYWEGMAGGELAAALGLPEGTLRTRLRRARQLLRQRLRQLRKPSPKS